MFQTLIIWILFAGAVAYLGSLFYKNFFSKQKGCGGNCGCSAVDMEKIEKQIKESMLEKKY